jgi:hypothetical protein
VCVYDSVAASGSSFICVLVVEDFVRKRWALMMLLGQWFLYFL